MTLKDRQVSFRTPRVHLYLCTCHRGYGPRELSARLEPTSVAGFLMVPELLMVLSLCNGSPNMPDNRAGCLQNDLRMKGSLHTG